MQIVKDPAMQQQAMINQTCSKCKVEKPLAIGFYKNTKCATGYNTVCKDCSKVDTAARYWSNRDAHLAYHRSRRESNPELYQAKSRVYRERNAEQVKARKREFYLKNRDVLMAKGSEWQRNNPDKVAARNAKWKKANPDKVTAQTIRRLEHIKRATPSWANEFFIEEAYHLAKVRAEKLGGQWHVDHIIPLRGKLVSGLHVENNLQVIPAKVNLLKNAKFQPV
jgi:hypothetical protein